MPKASSKVTPVKKQAVSTVQTDEVLVMTKEGLKSLQDEYAFLSSTRRKQIAARLKEAISYGDLSENSEYE